MAQLRTKQSVKVAKGRIDTLVYMLQTLKVLSGIIDDPTEIVITSIADGKHMEGSRHYKNEAIDIRSKNFPSRESKRRFRAQYQDMLGKDYRVLIEHEGADNEHFHAQVRKGVVLP